MGVAEEKAVQILLLRGIARAEQRLLHAVGVTVANEDTFIPDKQQPLAFLRWAEVAVAGDLVKLNAGASVVEMLAVPPAVPQMEDHPGRFPFHRLQHIIKSSKSRYAAIVISGIAGEALMVIGYFAYEAVLAALGSGSFNQATLAAGIASAATGIPFNIVQGVAGIIISVLLLPILSKVPEIREWIEK